MLTQMLCERTKSRSVADLLEGAARGRIDDSLFAPFVIEAAKQGDQASCRILDDAGERIGENAVHVIRTLGMEDLAFDLVLAGGMFRGGSHLFVEAVDHVVRLAAPNATFVALDAPPVVGAVLLAMDGIGEEPGPEVRGELTRPTEDKPTVTFAPPSDPDTVSHSFTIRVPDWRAAYETLGSRGARFLTPPVNWGGETRCFLRDPDGHLFELSQAK